MIKHLNGTLKSLQEERKLKLNGLISEILVEGQIYSEHMLGKLKEIIEKYET